MPTADTITDEQIRELRLRLVEGTESPWDAQGYSTAECLADCHVALFGSGGARSDARARCAEILNARAKESADAK